MSAPLDEADTTCPDCGRVGVVIGVTGQCHECEQLQRDLDAQRAEHGGEA